MKTIKIIAAGVVLSISALLTSTVLADGRGSGPVIYVSSQGMFFDSIVVADLPSQGNFQLLEILPDGSLQTEFGPGDTGYLGGRWWVDGNGNGDMDEGDAFFMCPLLGPGRTTP